APPLAFYSDESLQLDADAVNRLAHWTATLAPPHSFVGRAACPRPFGGALALTLATAERRLRVLVTLRLDENRSLLPREAQLVARLGGEEFVIVLPATDREHAALVAERVRRSVADAVDVTVSIGVAAFSPAAHSDPAAIEAGVEAERLLKAADVAVYRAKRDG